MAIEQNIDNDDDWFIGEDKTLGNADDPWVVYQADGTTRQNITGWAISWMLKRKATDADANALITKTTSSGITVLDALQGEISVAIADTDTDSLRANIYRHELKRTDAGFEAILAFGSCQLKQSVHRT